MLRSLVAGGHFDPKQKKVVVSAPDLKFADALYEQIKEHVLDWATGASSFVVVALLEAEDFEQKKDLEKKLKKSKGVLEKAAQGGNGDEKANAGAKLVLDLLSG